MEKQIAHAFPTVIGRFKVTDAGPTNAELRRIIVEREKTATKQVHTNVGGWHSTPDLLDWPFPAIGVLRNWIGEAVKDVVTATAGTTTKSARLRLNAWANICRHGNYHRLHNHPDASWSGVYYVDGGDDAPGQPLSGILELFDPRPFTEMIPTPGNPTGQRVVFKPEPGLMVLFPSWLYHFVHPYFGQGERISIAFNVQALPAAGETAFGGSGY